MFRIDGQHQTKTYVMQKNSNQELWHRRMGHINIQSLKKLKDGSATGETVDATFSVDMRDEKFSEGQSEGEIFSENISEPVRMIENSVSNQENTENIPTEITRKSSRVFKPVNMDDYVTYTASLGNSEIDDPETRNSVIDNRRKKQSIEVSVK
ncbi:hypothetical protein JTB14_012449 [Gonioctena quinquepunctata]|nr:hypothetical protein JTB14_012449 [Gonioctena quinquepunctata]